MSEKYFSKNIFKGLCYAYNKAGHFARICPNKKLRRIIRKIWVEKGTRAKIERQAKTKKRNSWN